MAVRKSKNGTWIADVSSGTNPITLIQRRIVRKGFKTIEKRAILILKKTIIINISKTIFQKSII